MLKVGEKVFVPKYGAGVVKSIDKRCMSDKEYEYICVYFYGLDMDFFIPTERIDNYNIRYVSDIQTIENILEKLKFEPKDISDDWNRRYRKNQRKLNSGNVLSMCEALQELYYFKKNDIMPPGEEKILEDAESMLASEVMAVLDVDMVEAYRIIKCID
ncbi:MAG: CarD family transcriptional regulator [Bacillota bacterium]|nr:CarD family transcriptional regulator [Bacillota bacterium]